MDIFEWVKAEEKAYSMPITIPGTDWEWNMKEHVRLTTLYKNSQFAQGNSAAERDMKPFNNVVLPILNVGYRTEGFDVKDINPYIDNSDQYFKSFLVKKYHDRWAIEEEMDEFIDDINESTVDYGGALARDGADCPEHIPLTKIAFCDQTNMLGGPIGIKHFYSPDELADMAARGWGKPENGATISIEEAIELAEASKRNTPDSGTESKTPGKYIECYEIHGVMREDWYKKNGKHNKYVRQMQVLLYYYNEKGERTGVKLFAGRERDGQFKVFKRAGGKIHGRALGRGGVEELFDAQVWANFNEIVMMGMLEAASKVVLKTTDPTFKQKHPDGLKNIDNLEVLDLEDGKTLDQVNTTPVNFELFMRASNAWNERARVIGAANDSLLGENPPAGTPFKLQNLIAVESHGLHDYRRGKYAAWMHSVYMDWAIPRMQKNMSRGKKFLEELSLDEMQQVADSLVINEVNKIKKEMILNGMELVPARIAEIEAQVREQFMKRGSKHFLEVLEREMDDLPISLRINIAGKQKNLDKVTDKLVNIFRQIIAAPQLLDDPRMAKLFNQIIEYSGLSPVDFGMAVPRQPIQKDAALPAAPADPRGIPTADMAAA
jgi:hypothetical protein